MAKTQSSSALPEGTLDVVIETPKGQRNKFKWDPATRAFRLGSVLPAGMSFPYDFGFVPDTKAEDGDPLDVLLLMDEPAFTGCRVTARVIGVIEAEQTEGKKTVRNDRIVAVAHAAHDYADWQNLKDVNPNLLNELEQFFVSYNATRDKTFRVIATRGPKRAMQLVRASGVMAKKKRRAVAS